MRAAHRRQSTGMNLTSARLAVSLMTHAEMRYGALAGGWDEEKVLALMTHLSTFAPVGVDARTAEIYAEILDACRRKGRMKGTWNDCIDMWIAATAVRFDWPLAALDCGFEDVPGLRLLLPDGSEVRNTVEQ
jgi:predicted nucleic acid-binding protein